jgi:putative OPT family oligopeptide transporter
VLSEFTVRALILGLLMCVVLGAANAYLGLKAGMTIAATYPAAVIGMAVIKAFKGSLLEENFARTVGSIGESIAAGAIFTIPAFVILKLWTFDTVTDYLTATALMIVGGILGILFVTILRRVMVEDKSLPFPESVAASEIHKAGQRGAEAAKQLFQAMGVGAVIKLLDALGVFSVSNSIWLAVGTAKASFVKLGMGLKATKLSTGGWTSFSAPAVSPAYISVGYIIGPELGALNFAGGLLAWGLFVPLLVYFLGPQLIDGYLATAPDEAAAWTAMVGHIYRFIVRPIAVGGMLVGACFTLWKMRKNLMIGIKRGVADVRKSAGAGEVTDRTEKDLPFKIVLLGIAAVFVVMIGLYYYFTGTLPGAFFAALVMIVTGFFFAAVSGNLVGMIGSSNNPISGLTLATTIIAALTMVIIGVKGTQGVTAVLGVAAVVCVSAAVAGEMLQDLKVGHILKGTPWKMQIGDIIGVFFAGAVMFFPLFLLHFGDIKDCVAKGINPDTCGFGGKNLSAPQAGLMAALSQGIVGGEMAWPLVVVGIAMGIALILIKVKSPMLFSVGMYLPLETTFAIFIGGLVRGLVNKLVARPEADQPAKTGMVASFLKRMAGGGDFNDAQRARVENAGVLAASGFIAGEALLGLLVAGWTFAGEFPTIKFFQTEIGYRPLAVWLAVPVALFLLAYLVYIPLTKAGRPDEPAPPTAVM